MLENLALQTDPPVLAYRYFMPVSCTLLISYTQHFSLWGRMKCFMWEQELTLIAMYDLLVISITYLLIWCTWAKGNPFFAADHKNSGLIVLTLSIPGRQNISFGDV